MTSYPQAHFSKTSSRGHDTAESKAEGHAWVQRWGTLVCLCVWKLRHESGHDSGYRIWKIPERSWVSSSTSVIPGRDEGNMPGNCARMFDVGSAVPATLDLTLTLTLSSVGR